MIIIVQSSLLKALKQIPLLLLNNNVSANTKQLRQMIIIIIICAIVIIPVTIVKDFHCRQTNSIRLYICHSMVMGIFSNYKIVEHRLSVCAVFSILVVGTHCHCSLAA